MSFFSKSPQPAASEPEPVAGGALVSLRNVEKSFPHGASRGVLWRALALGAVGYAMQAGLYFLALERMDAGVLSLTLPIAEKAKPRKVEIATSASDAPKEIDAA